MADTDSTNDRELVEDTMLDKIEEGLENGTITVKRAQELADLVLDTIEQDMHGEELDTAVEELKRKAPEFN